MRTKPLKKALQTLATLQDAEERIAAIKGKVTSHPITVKDRYRLQENVCIAGKTKTSTDGTVCCRTS
jgi:hypothetical protein